MKATLIGEIPTTAISWDVSALIYLNEVLRAPLAAPAHPTAVPAP